MTWTDDLATGVKLIDYQHKQLCEAIDRLLEACKNGKGRTEVITTITFLFDYTKKHFSDEEIIQKESGYPKCVEHKALHDDFVKKLGEVKEDVIKNGVGITTVGQVNSLLVNWLISHIKRVDKEISQYAK